MTTEEYKTKIRELKSNLEQQELELMKEFVRSNNPYKVGDIVTDHIGRLKIEKMSYSWGFGNPEAVYYGTELKKDGTVCKKQTGRALFQSNIIKL